MRLGPWILPLAWMGIIFVLSTGSFGAEATGLLVFPLLRSLLPWATPSQIDFLHWLGRKGGHVTEFAILAWLWYRALLALRSPHLGRRTLGFVALVLAVAYAIVDELHQGLTGQRTASAADVGLDALAAAGAVSVLGLGWQELTETLTTLLLWFSACGGSLLLLVALLAGAPAGWLWGAVPLAWIALWGWRRHRRPHGAATNGPGPNG